MKIEKESNTNIKTRESQQRVNTKRTFKKYIPVIFESTGRETEVKVKAVSGGSTAEGTRYSTDFPSVESIDDLDRGKLLSRAKNYEEVHEILDQFGGEIQKYEFIESTGICNFYLYYKYTKGGSERTNRVKIFNTSYSIWDSLKIQKENEKEIKEKLKRKFNLTLKDSLREIYVEED